MFNGGVMYLFVLFGGTCELPILSLAVQHLFGRTETCVFPELLGGLSLQGPRRFHAPSHGNGQAPAPFRPQDAMKQAEWVAAKKKDKGFEAN